MSDRIYDVAVFLGVMGSLMALTLFWRHWASDAARWARRRKKWEKIDRENRWEIW